MAAAELLATGSTVANSSDQTLSAGTVVGLKGYSDGASVTISVKDDAGAYNYLGTLTNGDPIKALLGSGTFRFSRTAGTCGVYSA